MFSDLIKARHVCQAIQSLAAKVKGVAGRDKRPPFERFPSTHSMFSHLHALLVSHLLTVESREWCPLVEQALATAYKLSNQPDLFAENLLKDLVKQVVSTADEDGKPHPLTLHTIDYHTVSLPQGV